MKKTIAALISISILLIPKAAFADPCPNAKDVVTGEVIKCDGTIMPSLVAKKLVDAVKHADELAKLEEEKHKALVDSINAKHELDLKQQSDLFIIEHNMRTAAEADVLKLTQPKSWYESPVFWGVTGVVTGVTLGVVCTLWAKGDL